MNGCNCSKEADIEVIKTHVAYIREKLDSMHSEQKEAESKYASKSEIKFHRVIIGGLFTALLTVAGWFAAHVKG